MMYLFIYYVLCTTVCNYIFITFYVIVCFTGRKVNEPELRQRLFDWFVEVRCVLKGPLPRSMFRAKAERLLGELNCETDIKFSDNWITGWRKEYNVSLLQPNKRFALSAEVRERRVLQALKNILRVRVWFKKVVGIDIPIINMDQMPLHRNETARQKSMSMTGWDTMVKSNHHLTRERVTCLTIMDSSDGLLPPHFVFKGKGTRLQKELQRPPGVTTLWAEKGSYRLDTMLDTIKTLPSLTKKDSIPGQVYKGWKLMLLDDYSVHITPEVL